MAAFSMEAAVVVQCFLLCNMTVTDGC